MDNHHLRANLLKLQERLSNDDRQRLDCFLRDDISQRLQDDSSLRDTLYLILTLFDQDKINEQDMALLINAFNKIQCTDFAQLLKQHMKRIPSNELKKSTENFLSLTTPQGQENWSVQQALIDETNCFDKNNRIINRSDTNLYPLTVIFNDQTKFALQSKRKQPFKILPKTPRWFFLVILLSIILVGVVIGSCFRISQLRMKYDNIRNEQAKNNEIIQHLNIILLKYNETIQESTTKESIKEDQKFIEGSTCGCEEWCKEHGSPYGVCGDGHTCICNRNPITKENIGDGCTCDGWCRKYGHKNGGICGDGYTCICSK